MPTTNWNLPLFGPADTAELDVLLNSQSNALDAALTSGITSFIGTDAQRSAFTGSRLREGITWRTTDTDIEWLYDGSNWITKENGLYLIRPTSVVGGTVGTDGHITVTPGASSISANGVFSARFKRYQIHFNMIFSTATGPYVRLRGAGADYSGANYNQRGVYQSGPSTLSTNNGDALSLWAIGGQAATAAFGFLELMGIQATSQKYLTGMISTSGSIGFHHMTGVLAGVDGVSYDGFTIYPQAGTFSSADISVYGLA